MSDIRLTRRAALAGAGSAAALALSSRFAIAQEKRLRMFWWGSKERADRTYKANDLYAAKFKDTKIDGETLGWTDYWPRVATQAAGRNLADVLQMDYRYIFEYARRGALMPLDQFMGKSLDIADFGAPSIDCGKVDGKIYGINLGNNSVAMLVNAGAFTAAGLKAPTTGMDWKEFAAVCGELTKKAGKDGFYGSMDAGGLEPNLETWLRQRGKGLYNDEGKVAFDADDMTEWFTMWDGMRKAKACVPADIQALDKQNIETNPLTLGKSAVAFAHSNQLVGYQAVNPNKLSIEMYPVIGAGGKPGQYLKPSMLFSIAANSKNAEEAAKVIQFYVKDPDGVKAVGVERGVPASPAARAVVSADLDDLGKAMVNYIGMISDKIGPLPAPPPKGAGEIAFLLKKTNEEVGFAKATPAEAGKKFHTEALAIIARG